MIVEQEIDHEPPSNLEWETIGRMQRALEKLFYITYLRNGNEPSGCMEGHIAILKQSLVMIVRSVASPTDRGNYKDARAYISFAEEVASYINEEESDE
jgi:hypothetical protein